MKKRFPFLALILAMTLALVLCACGGASAPPGESALKEDLYNSDAFSEYAERLDLEITDLKIVKRQTTPEDKVDTVWVCVNSSGPNVESCMYYTMVYNLYNDGWRFEYAMEDDIESWSYVPLVGVSDEVIASCVPVGSVISLDGLDLDTGTQMVKYTYRDFYTYCDVAHTEQIQFDFGEDYWGMGVWENLGVVSSETYEDWRDLSGNWYGEYRDDDGEVWFDASVQIRDFTAVEDSAVQENTLGFEATGSYTSRAIGFQPWSGKMEGYYTATYDHVAYAYSDYGYMIHLGGATYFFITYDDIYFYEPEIGRNGRHTSLIKAG